jgi:subtilisin family serine protease
VQWAAPDFFVDAKKDFVPIDPLYTANQWNLNNSGQFGGAIGADAHLQQAWDINQGSSSVVIAVMDDGVQTNHPDLNIFSNAAEASGTAGVDDDGNGWIDDINGWNFVPGGVGNNNANPQTSTDNHGTAVAGVAAAAGNSIGLSGVSRNAKILPIRIAQGSAFVGYARSAEALYYAAGRTANGLGTWKAADIVNISLSSEGMTTHPAFDAAVTWASSNARDGKGVSIFASSGNNAAGSVVGLNYETLSVTGLTAGNWSFEWRYTKNSGSVTGGDDTAWLANVRFPNGTNERFESLSLPSGWSRTGSGLWTIVEDPVHAYGTSRYVAKAGLIAGGQTSTLRSPVISISTTGSLSFSYWVSSEPGGDGLRLFASKNGAAYTEVVFRSGVPTPTSGVNYPANLPNVIAVGASTDFDYRAHYSQYGSALDIVAPSSGGYAHIATTDRTGSDGYSSTGDYAVITGTSASAPMAAGVAALMLSVNPHLTATTIASVLKASADKVGNVTYSSGFNQYYGFGRLNAAAAIAATPVDTISPRVVDVRMKGTSWGSKVNYAFSALAPLGQQLRPIPTQGVNVIEIQFSEPTNLISGDSASAASLSLAKTTRNTSGPNATPFNSWINGNTATFTYDPVNYIARWRFSSVLEDGKYAIFLNASSVKDLSGISLDADWASDFGYNPSDLTKSPTADVYGDDSHRAFVTGDSMPHSGGSHFRLNFALLAGDYNGDGIVTASDVTVFGDSWTDGNGDGITSTNNAADNAVRDAAGNIGDYLPLRRLVNGAGFYGADLKDDDYVNGGDLAYWKTTYGTGGNGDINGDSVTDGADFLLWQLMFGTYSAWSSHLFPGAPTAQSTASSLSTPPRIVNVIVSGSASLHAPFSMTNVDGSGTQLSTVPVGGADTISITFDQNVNVSGFDLVVVGLQTFNIPSLASFSYDASTHTATWRYEGWVAAGDQYLLALSELVTSVDGNWLDGEWTNPATTTTVNGLVSEFPSGDGIAGGIFRFVVTLLPGDANLDNVVNVVDYSILSSNYGGSLTRLFTQGDFNGDGTVSYTPDFVLMSSNYYRNLQSLWLKADFDGDFDVDSSDLNIIGTNAGMSTGATWSDGDLDGDGDVDMHDLDLAYSQFGQALNVVS